MAYTFEFADGRVRAWHLTDDGARPETREYAPSLFVGGPDDVLEGLRGDLESDPKVRETAFERRFADLHERHEDDPSRVLRVRAERVGEVRTLAREIEAVRARGRWAPGTVRLFDVDLAPGFRYCLDEGIDPTPARELRSLEIGVDDAAAADGDLSTLRIDGEAVRGDPADVCWSLGRRLERTDPDVLVLSHGDLVALLAETAERAGLEGFHLGRLPGWTRPAGENTYESDGRVGHSPARYRVPGRAIVDRSNGFLWHHSGLPGIVYVVSRTGRPLQEAARGSIGALLTARQIRRARREGVLAPWKPREPESFKDVPTLHAADRGGFTFAPEVGFHERVHEVDFASLYPRIICRHNVSPETVDCDCEGAVDGAGATETVPEVGYEICDRDGFLPGVLRSLLDDRAARKRELAGDPDESRARRLRAESGAIKWILVSSFGYQGYRNAKFGRIECHEAINAYAREILLAAKERLEEAGWRIVHGVVDGLWATPRVDDPTPLSAVTDAVSREVGIDLEREAGYEWVCFVPRRDSIPSASSAPGDGTRAASAPAGALPSAPAGALPSASAGALTTYFGKRDDGGFTLRGLEARRRDTPAFVADCQREFVEVLDAERDPGAVCDALERRLGDLRRGAVDPADLVVTKRASKPLAAYERRTRTVAALRRYDRRGIDRHPRQSVRYVVVDDGATGPERVRLAYEEPSEYDVDHYVDALVRATESVLSPLGWDRTRIRRRLGNGRSLRLSAFRD